MAKTREDMLAELKANPKVQAIVIGGGINGISTFRELALQGVRVLLVDRGDFCGACSSAPSRMIHGGLSYLENGEIGLVREALRERDALLRNAPHFVRPLPTTVPDPARLQRASQWRLRRASPEERAGRARGAGGKVGLDLLRFALARRAARCRHMTSAGARRRQRCGPTCRTRCASLPPITTRGSAIRSGWGLNSSKRWSRRQSERAGGQSSRRQRPRRRPARRSTTR